MEIKHEHVFGGGMNLDLAPEAMPEGVSRHLYNIRYNEFIGQLGGRLSSMKGTTVFEYVPGDEPYWYGINTIIGSAKDYKRMSVIIFVHNTYNYHGIFSCSLVTGKITRILMYPAPAEEYWRHDEDFQYNYSLKFDVNQRITDAFVVGDMLYWAAGAGEDKNHPQNKINIIKAYNFTHSDFVNGYRHMDAGVLFVAKPPPMRPPAVEYMNHATGVIGNNLRGDIFSFRYSYFFDDKESSTTSPVSRQLIPNEDYPLNKTHTAATHNNAIKVTVRTGGAAVTQVRLYYKKGDLGQWVLFHTIRKDILSLSDNSDYDVIFSGLSSSEPVDQGYAEQMFSAVPLLSRRQAFIDNKYLVYGENLEGFDYHNVDIDIVRRVEKLGTIGLKDGFIVPTSLETLATSWRITIHLSEVTHVEGNVISGTIRWQESEPNAFGRFGFSVTCPDDHAYEVGILVRNAIIDQKEEEEGYGVYMLPVLLVNGDVTVTFSFLDTFLPPSISVYEFNISHYAINRLGFKFGSKTGVYIRYMDFAGRFGSTIYIGDIPSMWYHGLDNFDEVDSLDYRYLIRAHVEINNLPPRYAHYYCILITRPRDISYYIQFVTAVYENTVSLWPLNLSATTVEYGNISTYEFEPGDRIRLITKDPAGDTSDETGIPGLGDRVGHYPDFEILGYAYNIVDGVKVPDFDAIRYRNTGASVVGDVLVEIYRPKAYIEDDVSYEIAEFGRIANAGSPGCYHLGNIQDQEVENIGGVVVSVLPAKVEISGGNTIHRGRRLYDDLRGDRVYFVEDDCYSDFAKESSSLGLGRIGVHDLSMTEKWLSAIRYSESYFEDTNINGLSMFPLAGRFKNFQNGAGPIAGLWYAGYVLHVIQENDNASIYIGRAGLEQASIDGKEVVVSTDKVLSTMYPSAGSYGCSNPESIIVIGRNIYFYSFIKASIVRKSPNGMENISERYGVSSELKIITDIFKTNGSINYVYSNYNQSYDELYFSFISVVKGSVVLNKTLVFGEEKNQFKFFIDLSNENGDIISGFNWLGNNMLSFMGGNVYLHDASEVMSTFYGSLKPKKVKFIASSDKENTFDAIAIYSNGKWEASSFDSIVTRPVDGYPLGMKTMLKESDFVFINGAYCSNIKMNAVLGSMQPSVLNMINGEPMRGNYIEIELVNMSNSQVWLSKVIVYGRTSELSG